MTRQQSEAGWTMEKETGDWVRWGEELGLRVKVTRSNKQSVS